MDPQPNQRTRKPEDIQDRSMLRDDFHRATLNGASHSSWHGSVSREKVGTVAFAMNLETTLLIPCHSALRSFSDVDAPGLIFFES